VHWRHLYEKVSKNRKKRWQDLNVIFKCEFVFVASVRSECPTGMTWDSNVIQSEFQRDIAFSETFWSASNLFKCAEVARANCCELHLQKKIWQHVDEKMTCRCVVDNIGREEMAKTPWLLLMIICDFQGSLSIFEWRRDNVHFFETETVSTDSCWYSSWTETRSLRMSERIRSQSQGLPKGFEDQHLEMNHAAQWSSGTTRECPETIPIN
jgi:hypothetical protein